MNQPRGNRSRNRGSDSQQPRGDRQPQLGPGGPRQGGPSRGRGPGGQPGQGPPRGRGGGPGRGPGGPRQGGDPNRVPGPRQGGDPARRSTPKGQLPDNLVYGINPVSVALASGYLRTLYFDQASTSERAKQLHAEALGAGIEVLPMARQGWSRILPAEQHQGLAGSIHQLGQHFIEEVVESARQDSCVLVLDRIQDPQNLGAILRSAAATGVDGVVLPKAGGCPVTPAVHKASAGMSLKVRIIEDQNLARTIDFLKENGYWVIGCDSTAATPDGPEPEDATTFEYPKRRVLVMGNEAEGLRRLVKESCDYIVRIPMEEGVESLNVSVATAVMLYLAKADLAREELDSEPAEGLGDPAESPAEDQDG